MDGGQAWWQARARMRLAPAGGMRAHAARPCAQHVLRARRVRRALGRQAAQWWRERIRRPCARAARAARAACTAHTCSPRALLHGRRTACSSGELPRRRARVRSRAWAACTCMGRVRAARSLTWPRSRAWAACAMCAGCGARAVREVLTSRKVVPVGRQDALLPARGGQGAGFQPFSVTCLLPLLFGFAVYMCVSPTDVCSQRSAGHSTAIP